MSALASTPKDSFLAHVRDGDMGGVIFTHRWGSAAEMSRREPEGEGRRLCGWRAVPPRGRPGRRRGPAAAVGRAGGVGARRSATPAQRMSPPRARAAAAALRRAGIDIDFAPVADTQLSPRSFLGDRTFSSDPDVVGSLAAAFVNGLQSGHVAATAKHFPGLGAATETTDDHAVSVRRVRLAPFRSAIAAGVKLVMVSNASYPLLDPSGLPAVFSPTIVTGLLRGELGFDGVVVTDALDAPTPAATPHAPARAIAAGVDLLLYTSASAARRGYESLLADAQSSPRLRQQIATAAARIQALKDWLGVGC